MSQDKEDAFGDPSSLLMSEGLEGEIDFEEGAVDAFRERAKLIVIKTRRKTGEPDAVLGALRGMGLEGDKKLTLEIATQQAIAIDFLLARQRGEITIHGVDLHQKEDIRAILPESENDYGTERCNIYDVVVEADECTLVLVFPLNQAQPTI